MSIEPSPVADVLPALDEVQTARAHAAARCLKARGFDVRCEPTRADGGSWYLGETFAFCPPRSASAPVGAAPEMLADALDAQQPLLDKIEASLGLAAEFADHGLLTTDCTAVHLSREGEALGAIAVWQHPPLATEARALQPLRVALTAARLPLVEAEALGPGDMVLLGGGAWPLAGEASQLPPTLAYDPATGRIGPARLQAATKTEQPDMTEPEREGLAVPVTLHLADTVLTPDELDDLATGGTVLLGPVEEGLQVALLVGGRAIGRGELVRLGDRFAVLLADPAASSPKEESAEATAEGATQP